MAGAPYKIEVKEDMLMFNLSSDITPALGPLLATDIREATDKNPTVKKIILNVADKFMFDMSSLRTLAPLGLEMRKAERSIFVLAPSKELRTFIGDMGMSSLLKPITTLDELKPPIAAPTPGAATAKGPDVEFVNPFIDGTIHTLKVQCQLECTPQKLILKNAATTTVACDITGVIGINCESFRGSIAICFSEKVFLGAMSNMLGEECKEITKDLEDGAGEMLNIIFGYAKAILNEKGHSLVKAMPTIVRGKSLEVKHMSGAKTILLPFETKLGNFFIEIGIESI